MLITQYGMQPYRGFANLPYTPKRKRQTETPVMPIVSKMGKHPPIPQSHPTISSSGSANAQLPEWFLPWTFYLNFGLNMVRLVS